jgi:hypothetical protein
LSSLERNIRNLDTRVGRLEKAIKLRKTPRDPFKFFRKILNMKPYPYQARFKIQLLGSEKHVLKKLQSLKSEDIAKMRAAFIQNHTPRFMKDFFTRQPYGRRKLYGVNLLKASLGLCI